MELKVIARLYCDLETKFGVPRQSGVAPHLCGKIIFEKEWRDRNAFKGIENFSHLWIIWGFSEGFSSRDKSHQWSPTVRPPILGGNERIGVFATRSPNRPNPLGLTSVKLEAVDLDSKEGPVLFVSGIDMMNQTPIYDIKPYIPYADIKNNASGGFTDTKSFNKLEVVYSDKAISDLRKKLNETQLTALTEILSNNPNPQYISDSDRQYGLSYAGLNVVFNITDNKLFVSKIE